MAFYIPTEDPGERRDEARRRLGEVEHELAFYEAEARAAGVEPGSETEAEYAAFFARLRQEKARLEAIVG